MQSRILRLRSVNRNEESLKNFKKLKAWLFFFLAILTLFISLTIPNLLNFPAVASDESTALMLEQQGKKLYDEGSFAEAAKIWQKAADRYGINKEAQERNLINQAKALQSLGLYPEACKQIISTLTSLSLSCADLSKSDIKATFFRTIEAQPTSLNQVIGLRLLGDLLPQFGALEIASTVLNKSLLAAEKYPEVKGSIFLSLGNLNRAIANKSRYESSYRDILITILDNRKIQSLELCSEVSNNNYLNQDNTIIEALKSYNQACKYYQQAANLPTPLTQIQAQLNQLTLLAEMQIWWNEQINIRVRSTKNESLKSHLNRSEISSSLNPKIINLISDIKSELNSLIQTDQISRETIYAQINFAHNLIRFNSNNQNNAFSITEIAKMLTATIQQARNLGNGDKQAEREALVTLARLYEMQVSSTENLTHKEQQYLADAKTLTEQALNLSHHINADNRQLLYRHRHLSGRILKAKGNLQEAIIAYNESWKILESLRTDLVTNVDNQFSFRQDVEPVYREYIDLLLQAEKSKIDFKKLGLLNHITKISNLKAEKQPTKELDNPLYIARIVMASLQLAELDNFFQQPCSRPVGQQEEITNLVDRANDQINNKAKNKSNNAAAVIYPIILNNSLEVILYQNGKSYRNPIHLKAKDVNQILEDLANIIYNETEIESNSAININDETENETEIESNSAININNSTENQDEQVSTSELNCDIRNDGAEELSKKSALYCNKKRIQELSQNVYNWLIKPWEKQLEQAQIKTLIFVLDRPFQGISMSALYDGKNYLVENYNVVINILGQQLIEPKPLQLKNLKILAAGVSKDRRERGEWFAELKNVDNELQSIQKLISPTQQPLLNENFTKQKFQAAIKSSPAIVHLATHGIFSSNRDKTFILTGDSSIGIDEFQELLNPQGKQKNQAIELLVLSACETASGDDKAALGIAGVVLRSGASSTVASLWPVSDGATAKLMKEFYHNLITNGMSRAEALSQAQRSLLNDEQYKHPFYWAPFILMGNWL